jgi:surface protein
MKNLFYLFVALMISQNVLAQTCTQVATPTEIMTWNGSVNTNWKNPCNWTPNGVPSATNQVFIPNVTNDPIVETGTTALSQSITLTVSASLRVNTGATLTIDSPLPNAIYLSSGSIFTNYGTTTITNPGNSSSFYALQCEGNTTINNFGTLTVDSPLNGFASLGAMNNKTGATLTVNALSRGIYLTENAVLSNETNATINATASFFGLVIAGATNSNTNAGTINITGKIEITTALGLPTPTIFTNQSCGVIKTTGLFEISVYSIYNNAGFTQVGTDIGLYNGTFNNNGVLKYRNVVSGTITNNTNASVIVKDSPTSIFNYGGTFNGTVNGIFTNSTATTSAGTFIAPNTFTPSGTLPNVIQTLYAKITPSGGACSYVVPFMFNNTRPFITTWKTDNLSTASSAANQITIPTNTAYTYNYTVDWGDGSSNSYNTNTPQTHTYATAGTKTVSITGTFPAIKFNDGGDKLKLLQINQWGTGTWNGMADAFSGCANMQGTFTDAPVFAPNSSLYRMFANCTIFNTPLNNWDMSNVRETNQMFEGASVFNGNVGFLNTQNITDMSFMFNSCSAFNKPLPNGFNTANVKNMSNMFANCTVYNQALPTNFITANVTDMSGMFSNASAFNQAIGSWNVAKVTDMNYMFHGASAFNQPLNAWNVGAVRDMSAMFSGASAFNQPLNAWNVSNVTDMGFMFYGANSFNQPLNSWNVGLVTNMHDMFNGASVFNQALNAWNVSNVTNMRSMFGYAAAFNQPIGSWNVANVTDMTSMFGDAAAFNQPIGSWNVANVTYMYGMFGFAFAFNQPIETWNVAKVKSMGYMFFGARAFNQPLNAWNVGNVTDMSYMFGNTIAFNQPIGSWNVSNVTNMNAMFLSVSSFNQDIHLWNVAKVTNMKEMFGNASVFNQPIGSWDVTSVTDMTDMFYGVTLSTANYDNLLIGWATQLVKSNVTFNGGNSKYCAGAAARQTLISSKSWTITDGGSATSTLTVGTATNPTTCAGTNGSIAFTSTNLPNGTYSLSFTATGAGATTSPQNVTVSANAFSLTGLKAGTYSAFSVTSSGCTGAVATSKVLTNPAAPTLTVGTSTNPTTCAGINGSIAFTSTNLPNGTYSLSFTATGAGATTSPQNVTVSGNAFSLAGLKAGTYSAFSVTSSGCTGSVATSKTLTNPAAPTLTVGTSTNPTTCAGINGSIAFTSTNLPNGTYSLSFTATGAGATTSPQNVTVSGNAFSLTGLKAGTYSAFSVTSSGCTGSVVTSKTLIDPAAPTLTVGTATNSTICAGGNGSIAFTSTNLPNGTYSLSFTASGAGATTSPQNVTVSANAFSLTGLKAGTYSAFSVTSSGCTGSVATSKTLTAPATPTLTVGTSTNPSTCAGTNGSIAFTSTNLPNGTYSLSFTATGAGATTSPQNVTVSANAFSLSGLKAGSYSAFSVTSSGCTGSVATLKVLTDPATPTLTAGTAVNPTTCGAIDGSIPFTTNLPDGNYSLVYTGTGSVATAAPKTITVSGGAFTLGTLGSGGYSNFSITNNACTGTATTSKSLNDPAAPVLTLGTTTNPTACNLSDGSIAFTVTNITDGTYLLTYSGIGSPQNVTVASGAFTLSGLADGTYSNFSITNGSGCTGSLATPVTLVDLALPVLTIGTATSPTTCSGTDGTVEFTTTNLPDGTYSLSFTTTGTTSPKNITVSSNAFTLSGLSAGDYSNFSITRSGCTGTIATMKTLANPATPTLTAGTASNPTTCSGTEGNIPFTTTNLVNGTYSLVFTSTGTSSPQNVTVANNAFTLSGLSAGNYSAFSITNNGCTGSDATLKALSNPTTPTITAGLVTAPTSCSAADGSIAFLSTNLPDDSYTITYTGTGATSKTITVASNAFSLTDLDDGTYSNFSITNLGCTASDVTSKTVNNPIAPTLTAGTITNPSTCASSDGSIAFTTTLPNGTYTLNYTGSGSPQTITVVSGAFTLGSLPDGTFSGFSVTTGGCTGIANTSKILSDPATATLTAGTPTNPSTCTGTNGSIPFTTTLPNGTYIMNYTGNNSPQTITVVSEAFTLTGLTAGIYNGFSITNGGCTSIDNTTKTLIDPTPPTAPSSPLATPATVCTSGTVTLSASGCTGGTLTWYDAADNSVVSSTPTVSTNKSFYAKCTTNACASLPTANVSVTVVTPLTTSPGNVDIAWTGAVSNDWNTACNWNPAWVPDVTNGNVTITSGSSYYYPIISGTVPAVNAVKMNKAYVVINSGATLNIRGNGTVDNGLEIEDNSALINNGTINIESATHTPVLASIYLRGNLVNANGVDLENNGTILVNSTDAGIGVGDSHGSRVNNNATGIITITNGTGIEVALATDVLRLTNAGTINYNGSVAAMSLQGSSSVTNTGTIKVNSGTGILNVSPATITNNACGKIIMATGNFDNGNGTTTNAGLVQIAGVLNNTGTFTNNGVLKYGSKTGTITNSSNSSLIVNNAPTPIFAYGGTFNGTVNGIYTDAAATISAGTFTAPNTFTASGTLPNVIQTLYAKITPAGGACSYVVPFMFNNSRPFITTWKTDNAGTSNSTSIKIPTTGTGYLYDVDWNNDGTFDQTGVTGNITHDYLTAGTYTVAIRGSFPRIYFNYAGDRAKLLSIEQWGDNVWASMGSAFEGCSNMVLNATDAPNTAAVTDMNNMFAYCTSFNQALPSNFNTAAVTDMSNMFAGCSAYNQVLPISFNTASVTNMSGMFVSCSAYNQALPSSFNTASVTNMATMFANCSAYNQVLPTNFNTEKVTNMSGMFVNCSAYNQALPSSFNTAAVTKMIGMFAGCSAYNQALPSSFYTAGVTNMFLMFLGCSAYNQALPTNFNTEKVTSMSAMFANCSAYNQALPTNFNTEKVTDMVAMFANCSAYNQAFPSSFNTASVTDMSQMFDGAIAFNQAIGSWNVAEVTNMTDMFKNVTLSTANYDDLLMGWATQLVKSNVPFSGGNSKYCAGATARQTLINSKLWTITDGGSAALTLTAGTATNPTTCAGTNGSIPFTTNLPDGTYSLSFTGTGSPQSITVASGVFNLTGLSAGTYSNFSVINVGCTGTDASSKTLTGSCTQIIYVNARNTNPTQNGTTWATAFNSLQTGLTTAATITGIPVEIWVAKGTYKPTTTTTRSIYFNIPSGVKVYGGFVGTETTITQRDFRTNVSILSGDIGTQNSASDNSYHVVYFSGSSNTTVLDGLTITEGNSSFDPKINGYPLTNNPAPNGLPAQTGGGILVDNAGKPIIVNCNIIKNTAWFGGGIFCLDLSTPTILESNISNNESTFGAAIYAHNASNFIAKNVLMAGNKGLGCVYNNSSNPVLTNCTIASNGGYNGGIFNSASQPVVKNSILWGNVGPFNDTQSIITYSTIEGGYAGVGNLTYDPRFINPAAFGPAPNTTGDYHLQTSSLAIDRADNGNISLTDNDLDGNLRRYTGGRVDMGAYEVQGVGTSNLVISVVTGSWEANSTWDVARVPQLGDYVIINTNHTVTINGTGNAKNVEHRTNGILKFGNTSAKLNIGF